MSRVDDRYDNRIVRSMSFSAGPPFFHARRLQVQRERGGEGGSREREGGRKGGKGEMKSNREGGGAEGDSSVANSPARFIHSINHSIHYLTSFTLIPHGRSPLYLLSIHSFELRYHIIRI